jgi:hypothetical protein
MKVVDRKRTNTAGRSALIAYLEEPTRRRTHRWLAGILGVNNGAISEWRRGLGRPSVPNALCLQKLAGIPLDAWLTAKERKLLARVEVAAHKAAQEPPVEARAPRGKKDERQLCIPGTEAA